MATASSIGRLVGFSTAALDGQARRLVGAAVDESDDKIVVALAASATTVLDGKHSV
jgi:hypothetical protein